MPIYCYQCDACGHEDEEFQHIREAALTVCPACQAREYRRVPTLPSTDLREFRKPIEMLSIALNTDEEIREFKQQCPDVEVSMDEADDLYGVPIARNRKQKLAALDAMGFEEKN